MTAARWRSSDGKAAPLELIWLELVLGFGAPLAWAVRELLILRRDRKRDHNAAAATLGQPAATDRPDGNRENNERAGP